MTVPALTFVFAAAWLTLTLAGGTPIAGWLHRMMIDAPARRLNHVTRGHVLLTVALLLFGGLLIWQREGDGLRLLSMMAPEIGTWLTMFEVSAWLDAVVAVIALSSSVRWRGWRAWVGTVSSRRRTPRARARRARRIRRAANTDDDGGDGRPSRPVRLAA